MNPDDRPVRVTLELGPYASRQIRLQCLLLGGTHSSAAKAMVDLGCYTAEPRVDGMSAAMAPPGDNVKLWQEQILNDEQKNPPAG
jgi:hypothetical protein